MSMRRKKVADPVLRGDREHEPEGRALTLRPRVDEGERRALGLIVFIAALLRVFSLETIPSGIHVDEAFNLLDAFAVMDGSRPVFLPITAL